MALLRHRRPLPPAGIPPGAVQAAHMLAEDLRHDGFLRSVNGLPPARDAETTHAIRSYGVHGAAHDCFFSTLRHWRLLSDGDALMVVVTSARIQHLLAWRDLPLRSIKRVRPRAKDWSVLDLELRYGDRLRLWGEFVPYLTVMLTWLVHGRVADPPPAPEAAGRSAAA